MTQIFRITHFKNLPFILRNGLHCPNSGVRDPDFVSIGFPTLVEFRKDTPVPVGPRGCLADYVPFYFWYKSPMLYVIHMSNDPEVIRTEQEEIVYIASSFEELEKCGCDFVFTDRHAKLDYANFFTNPSDVDKLDWDVIKGSKWARKYGSDRMEIKQAECLVHNHVPVEAVLGIAVMNSRMEATVNKIISDASMEIQVKIKPNFYY